MRQPGLSFSLVALAALVACRTTVSSAPATDRSGAAAPVSVTADTAIRLARVDGLQLAYRASGPSGGETMLLIGGTGMQLVDWPEELVRGLADAGYRVVVYDHRDVGRSTKLDSLGAPDWAAITRAGQEGRTPPLPYTLEDMADDAVGLLSALGVAKAHIIGASQGGIIAQLVAIRHPDRVLSVAPMMAGTGNPAHAMPAQPARLASIGAPPADTGFESVVDYQVRVALALAGRGFPADSGVVRERAERSVRYGYHAEGVARQQAAALVASFQDRRDALARLRVPAVVIQGEDDPIVAPEGAQEAAATIPGAELLMIPGMGHELPDAVTDRVVDAIVANAERAG